MTLLRSIGPYEGGVGTWANVYLPSGTPVRSARDTIVFEPAVEAGGEPPVRLVIGERDELVIDMSADMAREIGAVLRSVVGRSIGGGVS